jgi:15-cis-phytoene synthase
MTTQAIDPALTRAYETCRRMHRRFDPTYYWATRRLPEEIRPATHALYGYVRTADQIVDGPRRDGRPEARRAALDAWEAELEAGLAAGHSSQPVVGALVDAGRRHRLPLGELRLYMHSMRLDCAPVRIDTWDALVGYMEGSAGSVGRIMAPLLGVPEPHQAGFGTLGLAFQHANFIRDVREDRKLDRIYLPGEDRERFGVEEADFDRAAATPELRALVAHEVRRARGLFASAESAVEAAPASVRPGIRLACTIYLGVLDRVEALGYDVLGRRPRLPAWQLPLVALAALRR